MNMKKLCLLMALTGGLTSFQCFALNVNLNRYPIGDGNVGYVPNEAEGGEFSITGATPADTASGLYQEILAHYDASTISTVDGGFETFCLNISVELQPNPQSATVTQAGVTQGVAWLYSEFVNQTLSGYDYTRGGAAAAGGTGTGRANSAFELQNAIWQLEGQSGYDAVAAAGFVAQAVAEFGSLANAELAANGLYGVDQLILSYPVGSGNASQPMLAVVPDGGATAMLLGMALGGFGLISRKLRRA